MHLEFLTWFGSEFFELAAEFFGSSNTECDGNRPNVCKALIMSVTAILNAEELNNSPLSDLEIKKGLEMLSRATKLLPLISPSVPVASDQLEANNFLYLHTFNSYSSLTRYLAFPSPGVANGQKLSFFAENVGHLLAMLMDEVISFPLYVEALKFAFHEDSTIRVALCTLTLNVYHVGDESVNRFVSCAPLSDYFSDMVNHFQKQCIDLDKLVVRYVRNADSAVPTASVEDTVVQIEDTLYYFSDVMSPGIPDLGRFITENILQLLVFRFLLPSLQRHCINKDMASAVDAALFHQPDFPNMKQGAPNGYTSEHDNGI
ncbi:hypothetical protein ABZP36_003597 [Zizania latifolia]